jgi:hypothetical protein
MHQLNSSVHPKLRIGASPRNAVEHRLDFHLGAIKPKLVRLPFVLQLADRLPSKPRMSAATSIPEPTPILHHQILLLNFLAAATTGGTTSGAAAAAPTTDAAVIEPLSRS